MKESFSTWGCWRCFTLHQDSAKIFQVEFIIWEQKKILETTLWYLVIITLSFFLIWWAMETEMKKKCFRYVYTTSRSETFFFFVNKDWNLKVFDSCTDFHFEKWHKNFTRNLKNCNSTGRWNFLLKVYRSVSPDPRVGY